MDRRILIYPILGFQIWVIWHIIFSLFFFSFMNVPFLYELRTLMDWIWTNTSMNLGDWIKMEDIFVRIFLLKVNSTVVWFAVAIKIGSFELAHNTETFKNYKFVLINGNEKYFVACMHY